MKVVGSLFLLFALLAYSTEEIEKLAFRKPLEYDLAGLYGKQDKACILAVESQVQGCMESSSWRKYLIDHDNEAEWMGIATRSA